MQGARFVETNLVQKMLRNQNYEFHKKKLDQIQTEQQVHSYDLAKSQDMLSKICQYQVKHNNQKHSHLDFRNLNKESELMNKTNFQLHISQKFKKAKTHNLDLSGLFKIQDRKPMQVELLSFKADTSIWSENALGKRLHSPLRRKQQQKIDEENQELQKRLELTKQILLEKQQEQIQQFRIKYMLIKNLEMQFNISMFSIFDLKKENKLITQYIINKFQPSDYTQI